MRQQCHRCVDCTINWETTTFGDCFSTGYDDNTVFIVRKLLGNFTWSVKLIFRYYSIGRIYQNKFLKVQNNFMIHSFCCFSLCLLLYGCFAGYYNQAEEVSYVSVLAKGGMDDLSRIWSDNIKVIKITSKTTLPTSI